MKFEPFVGPKHQEWMYDYQTNLRIMQNALTFSFMCVHFIFILIGYHPIIYVQLKVNIYKMILK